GFNILKAAIISTGIGALVLALGGLISYFTKTQSGLDTISRLFAQLGAISGVLTDRLSAVGERIVKAFSDPKQAILDLGKLIIENITNRFEAIFNILGKVGSAFVALASRDMGAMKKALSGLGSEFG